MKIASRFEYKTEKCPICLNISQNHLILGDTLWGCLRCGCVFVPKFIRDLVDVKALLVAQDKKYICECGREFKNGLGLASHKRGSKCLWRG